MKTVTERFLTYVKHNTKSNYDSTTFPSTRSQLLFADYLAKECKEIGLSDITVDENGYVMATLPATVEGSPVIGFIAHMDTSPDAKGEGIMPNIVEKYDGGIIPLNNISLSPDEFPVLQNYIGETLITSDGTTLLGADDKAGIAEILTAMDYLKNHPEIPHGKIRIAFTPDEEVGHGVDYFDVKAFGADFAYTIDGGELGELQYENFNAARATIQIEGKNVHPGMAKNIMVNAALVGTEIATLLPEREVPSKTEGYEGFFHLCSFEGTVSFAKLSYIIRDFDSTAFDNRKSLLKMIIDRKKTQYPNAISLEIRDEYYNMFSSVSEHMSIVELATEAMNACEVSPIIRPIRGGTDGARLSYMSLPCPNLFTGGHNFHGPYEFIPVSSMEKAVKTIIKIAEMGRTLDF
ncbi:peptidase T [Anaerotignum sp. MB30-C6]|uniref:peptidase T n=1 Tax=Anaerotignum sp. MB30-C6 TaxID=3070814 RepID=UPI0027DD3BF2|nr:peptidase T [Anaerotignum sp. MB30-C6]WMI81726.1 peptidase T [Anaerotignum sp. MB30-C6]